jgi:hypothetical protein
MALRAQTRDAADTPFNKEFQMASSGPRESGAHRRKPAAGTFLLLIVVIAIVLVVLL